MHEPRWKTAHFDNPSLAVCTGCAGKVLPENFTPWDPPQHEPGVSMRLSNLSLSFLFALLAALGTGNLSADGTGVTAPTMSVQASASPTTPVAESVQPRLQFGIGYPDLRARFNLLDSLDGEIKVAYSTGALAYGARLYWSPWNWMGLAAEVGAEAGGLNYSSVYTLNGDGFYGEPFAGLQYTFLGRWTFLADIGPAWIDINSEGQGLTRQQWIVNTALYLAVF